MVSDETILRQSIQRSLNGARSLIISYTGLYPQEELVREVLSVCDELTECARPSPQLAEARRIVRDRCVKLTHDADRFSARDPATIAASRMKALAAIDGLQDALLHVRKVEAGAPRIGALLRRKSL